MRQSVSRSCLYGADTVGLFSLGPTFDPSELGLNRRIAAEADLIAGGLLIDVKTTLSPKNKRDTAQTC